MKAVRKIIKALPAPAYAIWGSAFGLDKEHRVTEDDVAAWYVIAVYLAAGTGLCNFFGWLKGTDLWHYTLLAWAATLLCRLTVLENEAKLLKEAVAKMRGPSIHAPR